MRKFFNLTISFVVCILLVSSLFAIETGEIKGKVVDNEGVSLPGVIVAAKSPNLQGTRTAVTGEDGAFRLSLLPIGTYQLTYELPGFTKIIQEEVMVRLGMTTSIQTIMTPTKVEEEITVIAEFPLIDKTKTDTSYRMSAEDLARAPIQGRTIQEVVAYTPGVTGVRADTLGGSGSGNPVFRGEGEEGNQWLVDGLSSRGVRTHSSGVSMNFDSWDEIQVISDGFTPDLGQAFGGIINIVTKSGGNEFHGEVGALIRDWHLRNEREDQLAVVAEPNTSLHQYYGNIGGPLIKDKLWFFVSDNFHRRADDTEEESIGWLTVPEGQRRRLTNNAFGKITFTPIENHTFFISGNLDKFLSQSGGFGLPELYTKTTYTNYSYRINYKGILSANTLVESALGQSKIDSTRKPLEENYGTPQYYFYDITQYTNNSAGDRINIEKRTDFSLRLTQYLDTGSFGNHELGAGFSYYETYGEDGATRSGTDFDCWLGNGFDSGTAIDWNEPGSPEVLTEYGYYGFYNTTKGIGLYIKDKVTIDRFTLMLGLRSETQTIYDDMDEKIWTWNLKDYLSPRISLAIDLLNDGNNILKFGYGKFSDTATTRIAEFFNYHAGYTFRRYNWIGSLDPTESQLKEASNWFFVHEQSSESNPMDYDPDMKPNSMQKFIAEFDRRLGPDWAFKIRGIYSEAKELLDDIAIYDPEEVWYWFLTNYEDKRRDYKAVEVELNGRISDRLMLNASYTWSQAKGTNPGQFELGPWAGGSGSGYFIGVFGDHVKMPEDSPYYYLDEYTAGLGGRGHGDEGWYGFLPYSVDHTVKILSTYLAPYDFVITAGIEYLSGYHWEKKGFQWLYGDFLIFPEGRGSRTTPAHAYVDLSVEKDFVLTQGFNIGLRLNVYNLLNSQKPISYVKADTSLFGSVWGRQDPRWFQFQVLFKW